jgi:hypothetical protein
MIMRMIMRLSFAFFLIWGEAALAASSGLLFNVSATGTPANVSITLCLNGKEPLSCQNYTVSALSLSIKTAVPHHFYPAAGIKINTPGYILSNIGLTCTENSNGYCLFSASDTQAKTFSLEVSGGSQYMYVADGGSSSVYQCTFSADGSLNTCVVTPSTETLGVATAVAFATVNGIQYAYVATNNKLYQCNVNNDGNFHDCSIITPASGPISWNPIGLTFATINTTQYAYVASAYAASKGVFQCSLDADGGFSSCAATPVVGVPGWQPFNVTFATINTTQYAYVASPDGPVSSKGVLKCSLNADGSFSSCARTPAVGAPAWTPFGTTITTVNGIPYAYVTDNSSSHVYQCSLNADGSYNACSVTPSSGAPSWKPFGITTVTVNGIQYAYVADSDGTKNTYQCSLNTNGSFNVCISTPTGSPFTNSCGVTAAFIPTA